MVHNGKLHIKVFVTEDMVAQLGELAHANLPWARRRRQEVSSSSIKQQ